MIRNPKVTIEEVPIALDMCENRDANSNAPITEIANVMCHAGKK
jgi:hypothetical protein